METWRGSLAPRIVTLVLCQPDGQVLGALAPFRVDMPWWQEVAEVVEGARAHHGVEVTILRLLEAEPRPRCAGGPVTYLAEVDGEITAKVAPWTGDLDPDEPLRATWARPGGPAADLAWAEAALGSAGISPVAPAQQIRTWNLSSLWRLPTSEGATWLKVVPPFFAHEGIVLTHLGSTTVPALLATEGPRLLVGEVPGPDHYGAGGPILVEMVELLVALQAQWIGHEADLISLGAPDWRAASLTVLLEDLVAGAAPQLDRSVATALDLLVSGLPERFTAVAACGLPDTLVHGDFHRGNLRGPAGGLVLLDWGDCGAGNPMLDQAAFLDGLGPDDVAAVRNAWSAAWRRQVPDCDPERAAELLGPVSALRQALIYEVFLAGIEPAERVYHARDPVLWLTRAGGQAQT